MEVFVSSLRALDFVCPLKQAPGRAYSERNVYDCAQREIERAGIKQDLKGIAHTHSPTFRIGADSAHSFLDGLEDAFRSKRRGNPGGSLEATRRSFNKDFLLALAADFKKHGAAAIEKVREQQPAAYMKICALLVPREMKLEHAGGVKAMSDERIVEAIAAIEGFLARRSGETAKVIEGEAEVVPSLPAPARPTKAS